MMATVNRAYGVLSDPEKRAEYDRSRTSQTAGSTSRGSQTGSTQGSRPESGAPRNPRGYFTLGSSKSDVADIHGTNMEVSVHQSSQDEIWDYDGSNAVQFDLSTGRVIGWANTGNLRVRLVSGPSVTTHPYFRKGSHRDEVVRLQGTPNAILVYRPENREVWVFLGGSQVEFSFSTGLVTGWENKDGALKVRRETKSGFRTGTGYSRSSTGGPARNSRMRNQPSGKNPSTAARRFPLKYSLVYLSPVLFALLTMAMVVKWDEILRPILLFGIVFFATFAILMPLVVSQT